MEHPHYLLIESEGSISQNEFSGPIPRIGDLVVAKPLNVRIVSIDWYLDAESKVMRANVRGKSEGYYQNKKDPA